jgi:hypothetical protein
LRSPLLRNPNTRPFHIPTHVPLHVFQGGLRPQGGELGYDFVKALFNPNPTGGFGRNGALP